MKVDELLPEVYYKESRDFSYIGRLFEIVFNYMKTQADLVSSDSANENANSTILELTAKTLGFETKHKYINKDLSAVINNFNSILKEKGTENAIRRAAILLSQCHNLQVDNDSLLTYSTEDNNTLIITLPFGSTDVILFEDLLNYILPCGWLYEIKYSNTERPQTKTEVKVKINPPEIESINTNTGSGVLSSTASTLRYDWPTGNIPSYKRSE